MNISPHPAYKPVIQSGYSAHDEEIILAHISNTQAPPTTSQIVISNDGTRINYQTIGAGSALIIIPGALSMAADYLALATALAGRFTVHIIERRGRGLSGAMGADYSITKECEDVAAVQAKTGAHLLFGHSYGGLIAFEAARCNPAFSKIAVYEPGVSINQSIPIGWSSAYQAHLAAGKPLDAFIDFIRGSGPAHMKMIPNWWLRLIMPMIIKGAEWDKTVALLPANLREHQEVARLDNSYPNYREVSAVVLLMSGGKSPAFREQTLQTLSGVLPQSTIKIFPKLDHFGPTSGVPSLVADALKAYFIK